MWLYVPRSTTSACVQVEADSISASSWQFQVLARSCSWRGKLSPSPLWYRRWKTASWLKLLCGVMCEPSTGDRGAASWMASLEASRVNLIPSPANALARRMSATCGPMLAASSFSPARGGASSRTSRGCSRPAGPSVSGATFADLALKWRADCLRRQKSARRMNGSASSSSRWPTPDASVMNDAEGPESFLARQSIQKAKHRNGNGMGTPLAMAVRLWATPRASDGEKGGPNQSFGAGGTPLPAMAAQWQTPSVADTMGSRKTRSGRRSSELLLNGQSEAVSRSIHPDQTTSTHGAPLSNERRSLNPRFVEWMMGWPEGWTNFECSGMALIRYRRRMRSALLALGLPDDPPH